MRLKNLLAMMATVTAGLAASGCSEDGAQPPAVASVDVVAPAVPLAVYGSVQLSATARDAAGNLLPDRTVTWSSGTPALASVSATGSVTALAAGNAIITATAEGRTGSVTIAILPAPVNSVTLQPGVLALVQGGTAVVTAELRDERGAIVSDRAITWSSGSTSIAAVTGAGSGTSSATVQGLNGGSATITALVEGQTASASVTVTDTVASVQVTPATVSLQPGQTVALSAAVRNGSGAALNGRAVSWQSSAPNVASVSNAGVVNALVDGTATITATSEGKSATSVITVAAPKQPPPGEPPPAAGPVITGVTPNVLVAGSTATITGSGLAAAGNTVSIGGVNARVVTESATQLQVTVPCIPTSSAVAVRVTTNAVSSAPVQRALQVTRRHSLGVGESVIIDGSSAVGCSEFPASSGQSRYVVAVYNTMPSPSATADYTVSGFAAGTGTGQVLSSRASAFALAPAAPVRTTSVAPAVAGSTPPPVMAQDAHHGLMEKNRVAYEALQRQHGAAIVAESLRPQAQSAAVEPPVNATIRVSNINSNSICSNFYTIQATRVYYAGKLAIYEDDATPTALKAANNSLMASYYKRIGDSYNETMEPVVREYFGDPLRRDALTDNDGVLRAVFTPVINNHFPNVAGFVVSCDLYPTTPSNSQSNHGEYFYAHMPVNTNTGYSVGTPEYWFWTVRTTFIHEAKHVASFVARQSNNASWESGWLEEGTARHAEELWARNAVYNAEFRGNTGYGSAASPTSVYCDVRPSWDSCNGTNPNRPSNHMQRHFGGLYSFLGNSGLLSPFGPSAADGGGTYYAVAWSFIRYVADRYAQNERSFFTALNQSTTFGTANLSARAGVPISELLGRWALALYADDMPGLSNRPELQFATWNMPNVYAGLRTDFPGTYQRATPLTVNFLPFGNIAPTTPAGLVGGGVHYYEISGSNAAGQTFQLQSTSGGAPSSVLNMAVLRVQ